jgi:hypothetical protein
MATRRTFSSEFKREAVRLVKDCGVAITQAARDLDLQSAHMFACSTRIEAVQLIDLRPQLSARQVVSFNVDH